tara:strand:- start:87 stop:287 length:201 start_codon:yes stop_codon:yes gene_type:complete
MQQICKMTEEHKRIISFKNNIIGGQNTFKFIINPKTREKFSIFSKEGKKILKELINKYENFMKKNK